MSNRHYLESHLIESYRAWQKLSNGIWNRPKQFLGASH